MEPTTAMSLYHHTDELEGTGNKNPAEAGPLPPLGLYAEWASENMVDGICAILPEDMLSHLKKSHQRESKLGLEKAQSRHGIRQHNMKPADRFTQKLNDKPYLFSFILEGISSVPTYKGIREHTIFYVIWDNIKILAIYILTVC